MIFEAYFDESGDISKDPGIFCIAGYFIESKNAKLMDDEWRKVLKDHKLSHFHMVDCAHGIGEFEGISTPERVEIEKKCISLIHKYTMVGFSVVSYGHDYEKETDVYSSCAAYCVEAFRVYLSAFRLDQHDIAYFFESGHQFKGAPYNKIAEWINESGSPISFLDKRASSILQAADLYAWQLRKYLQDQISGQRKIRKDFEALMEHAHDIFHCSPGSENDTVAIEFWPLSRRERSTIQLEPNYDCEIPYFTEGRESTPIIMLDAPCGYRVITGGIVLNKFSLMGGKEVILGLDNQRLYSAIASLFSSSKVLNRFEGGDIPAFAIRGLSDVQLKKYDDGDWLHIKDDDGVSFAVELTPTIVEKLKKELDKI